MIETIYENAVEFNNVIGLSPYEVARVIQVVREVLNRFTDTSRFEAIFNLMKKSCELRFNPG